MDTTSYYPVSTTPAAAGLPFADGMHAVGTPYSTAALLQRTTTPEALEPWPYPIDHAALERRAHELRTAYIAELARRWMKAIRRGLRQTDGQARFIWP